MKKKIMVLAVLFLLTLNVGIASAFTEPGQGTDNATDVILWYGDNLTITDLEDSLTAAGEAQAQVIADALEDRLNNIISLALVILFVGLAFWHRDRILYVLAGAVCILYGFDYWTTSEYTSIALAVGGMVIWWKAAMDKRA